MTTSVDILFKELPPVSQTGDRINRTDASSVGSTYGQGRASDTQDKINNKHEKKFSDHLDDHKVKKEKTRVSKADKKSDSYHTDKIKDEKVSYKDVDDTSSKSSDVSEKKNINQINKQDEIKAESEKTSPPEKHTQEEGLHTEIANFSNVSEEKEQINITETLVADGKDTKETDQNSNNNAPEVSIDPEKASVGNEDANIKVAIEESDPTEEKPISVNDKKDGSPSTENSGNFVKDEDKPVKKQSDISKVNQDAQTEKTSQGAAQHNSTTHAEKVAADGNTQNSESKSVHNEFSDFVHEVQETQKEIKSQNVETRKSADQPNNVELVNNLPQEAGKEISAAAKEIDDGLSKPQLMDEPTVPNNSDVATDAKNISLAASNLSENNQKQSSSDKKEGNPTATDKVKKAIQNSANSSPSPIKENQNIASSATPQNTIKSDIQLDLGIGAQKFDALLPQNTALNGQPQIANGGLLVAQQVHTQNAALHEAGVLKTDGTIMTKMINEQITVAINKNVGGGHNNFSIRLNPAELGQVDVKLEFMADGKMHASMMVESEKTLSMLQRDQHSLGRALQDAGLNLTQKEMSFSLMKQSQEQNSQQFASSGRPFNNPLKSEEFIQADLPQYVNMGYSNQAIDISV